tara:strand:- start:5 stop:193 length:189 start_codon:yes stop_codon:yes gene_type:complete
MDTKSQQVKRNKSEINSNLIETIKACLFIAFALVITILIAYGLGNWLGPIENQNSFLRWEKK